MFEELLDALKTLADLKGVVEYTGVAASSCAVTATFLYRTFRKKEAADKKYADAQEELRKAADKRAEVRDEENKKLKSELERVSATEAWGFATQELSYSIGFLFI